MNLSETLFFINQITQGFDSIGAILPTSRQAAKAVAAEALRQQTPKTILEVGPGTGPITTEIVKHMKASDRLVLCEISRDFCAYLYRRIGREPDLRRVRKQIEIHQMSVVDLPGEHCYDYIISAIPFTNLPAETVEEIFATYKRLLKPGGTLSFLEYSYFRQIRKAATTDMGSRFFKVNALLSEKIRRYQFRNEQVLLNLPPATIRSLRFTDPPSTAAATLSPRENFARVGPRWSQLGMSSEGLDIVAGMGFIAALLARRSSRFWPIPLALGAAAAWMHRDPHREVFPHAEVAYAASDGRVMKVDVIRHPRLGDQEWVRVAVYLSPTDVHINRAPVAGKVVDRWDEPGGFLPAYKDASEANASRYTVIEGVKGRCVVAQRADFLTRRVVTWPKKSELLAQGERIGMIRFGSRTDVLFPVNSVMINVKAGDRVVAGQTVMARYPRA